MQAAAQSCLPLGGADGGAQQFTQEQQEAMQVGSCGKALLI